MLCPVTCVGGTFQGTAEFQDSDILQSNKNGFEMHFWVWVLTFQHSDFNLVPPMQMFNWPITYFSTCPASLSCFLLLSVCYPPFTPRVLSLSLCLLWISPISYVFLPLIILPVLSSSSPPIPHSPSCPSLPVLSESPLPLCLSPSYRSLPFYLPLPHLSTSLPSICLGKVKRSCDRFVYMTLCQSSLLILSRRTCCRVSFSPLTWHARS